MSALDSGVNSIATVTVVDLMKPYLAKGRNDRFYLATARIITGVAILVAVAGALFFSHLDKESMNDVSLIVFSVLGGAVTGLFLIGFFTQRVDGFAANVALALSIMLNIYLGLGVLGLLPERWRVDVHSYWVGAVVNLFFMVCAYTVSVLRRNRPGALPGLTVWTQTEAVD